MPHDVFISHSTQDREIAGLMCAALEKSGQTCWIAPRDIGGGEVWDEAIMSGLESCRLVLLVFSRVSNDSLHVKKEILKAVEKHKYLLPVRIEDIQPGRQLEYQLAGIQWFDAFAGSFESYLPRLTETVENIIKSDGSNRTLALGTVTQSKPMPTTAKPQIALLYKRNAQPDGYVVNLLEKTFVQAGYGVFLNREIQSGMAGWSETERNIRSSFAVIPILSETSILSEMLELEVTEARNAALAQDGQPRLVPVRIPFEAPLGAGLDALLRNRECEIWNSPTDDETITQRLLQLLAGKDRPDLEQPPGGGLPPDTKFYVSRPSDEALKEALNRKDTIVLIKGGRQIGKTSLMARGLKQARETGATVVFSDLQKLNSSDMANIRQFYIALAHMVAEQVADKLDIDDIDDIEDTWKENHAPSVNFERYLKKQIMTKVGGHLFWALDEVDRLFTTEFGSEVFGLFRSWHNERASNPDTPFSHMTMIIAYATEAHLFIADPNQSPFNIGTKLELRDFNMQQEETLNRLFGRPLSTDEQVTDFYGLVNGQPYLVARGLDELSRTKMPFAEFVATADLDEGPFGDHLRRILVMLARDQKMIKAVKTVLDGSNTLTMESFYRLRAAGLVVGEGASSARIRCQLYASYLRGHLKEPV